MVLFTAIFPFFWLWRIEDKEIAKESSRSQREGSQPLAGNFIVPKLNHLTEALSFHFSISLTAKFLVHNVGATAFFSSPRSEASVYFICPVISYGTWPCKMLSRVLLNRRRGAKRMSGRSIVKPKKYSLKEIQASDSCCIKMENYSRDIRSGSWSKNSQRVMMQIRKWFAVSVKYNQMLSLYSLFFGRLRRWM